MMKPYETIVFVFGRMVAIVVRSIQGWWFISSKLIKNQQRV